MGKYLTTTSLECRHCVNNYLVQK